MAHVVHFVQICSDLSTVSPYLLILTLVRSRYGTVVACYMQTTGDRNPQLYTCCQHQPNGATDRAACSHRTNCAMKLAVGEVGQDFCHDCKRDLFSMASSRQ
jgi:hypothetical protein